MRKVFLDDLPHKGKFVDWQKSIGMIVGFTYDNIEGYIKIIDYIRTKRKLIVEYNNISYPIRASNFALCTIGDIIGIRNFDYKYSIGDVIENKCIVIRLFKKEISKSYIRAYELECLFCHEHYVKAESQIGRTWCPVCCQSPQKVVIGINDMRTTNPDLAKLLANPEDGYKYTQSSGMKTNWKCPDCGEIIYNKTISNINKSGISCPCCSDGISFPEKAFYAFCVQMESLELINNFENQYSPNWIKNLKSNFKSSKRYDFYLHGTNNEDFIVETHGGFHYVENKIKGAMPLIEVQKNDSLKFDLAQKNSKASYLILDVRESTIEWFKNSIMTSILPECYGFTEDMIDWDIILNFTFTNLKKKAWELWETGYGVKDISEYLHICKATVFNYLRDGAKYNKCSYLKEEAYKRGGAKVAKKVICVTTNIIYNSVVEASVNTNVSQNSIASCCRGILNSAGYDNNICKRLEWEFYDNYINNIKLKINKIDARKIKVICLNTLTVYTSITEASKLSKINIGSINACCLKKYKYAGKNQITGEKFKWMYYDEYLKQQEELQLAI